MICIEKTFAKMFFIRQSRGRKKGTPCGLSLKGNSNRYDSLVMIGVLGGYGSSVTVNGTTARRGDD
jgi:hypothetical protein